MLVLCLFSVNFQTEAPSTSCSFSEQAGFQFSGDSLMPTTPISALKHTELNSGMRIFVLK